MYFTAFPDFTTTVEDVLGEEDRVALRWRIRATHGGEMMGIPATGKEVEITGIYLGRVEGDRIAESWERSEAFGLMRQLGVVPAPGEGPHEAPREGVGGGRGAGPGASAEQTREVYVRFDRRIYNEHDIGAGPVRL